MHALMVLGYWNLFKKIWIFDTMWEKLHRKMTVVKMKSHSLDQFFNVCQLAVQDISCIHVAVNDH